MSEKVVRGRYIGTPTNGLQVHGITESLQGEEFLSMGHFYSSTLHKEASGRWVAVYYDRDKEEGDWRELSDSEAEEWKKSWLKRDT